MITPVLAVLSWILVGPPLPISLALEAALTLGVTSVLRYRFNQKTFALITLMGLMLIQSVIIVIAIGLQLWSPPHPHVDVSDSLGWLAHLLFALDLRAAEIGLPAAVCAGLYIQFAKSKLNLSQVFPSVSFLEPTQDVEQTVASLAETARIKCPLLKLVDSGVPTAFTVHNQGEYTIAVSIGLLETFDRTEVEACLAHEISHIKNNDFVLRTIITIAKIALFARVLSYLVESAFYRTRELLADRTACSLIGGPAPLISALTKLQSTPNGTMAGATICCFDGKKSFLGLFSKHPKLETRIDILKQASWRGNTESRYRT